MENYHQEHNIHIVEPSSETLQLLWQKFPSNLFYHYNDGHASNLLCYTT